MCVSVSICASCARKLFTLNSRKQLLKSSNVFLLVGSRIDLAHKFSLVNRINIDWEVLAKVPRYYELHLLDRDAVGPKTSRVNFE